MKIVFTSNLYYPILGGSVHFLHRIASHMVTQGHDVTILTRTESAQEDADNDGSSTDRNAHAGTIKVIRKPGFLDCVKVIRYADKVISIEMSIKWLIVTLLAARTPIITHHTHYKVDNHPPDLVRITQRLLGLLLPSYACSTMIAMEWGKHVKFLPNPLDRMMLNKHYPKRDINFLFAGRFTHEKGVDLFLDAMNRLSQINKGFRFAIAGSGPLLGALEEKIDEYMLHDNLAYMGECTTTELVDIYNRSETVVIPSIWIEPFGLVAIEALRCGCQLICSDQPGLREASSNFASFFSTGDIESLMSAIDGSKSLRIGADELEMHLCKHDLDHVCKLLIDTDG